VQSGYSIAHLLAESNYYATFGDEYHSLPLSGSQKHTTYLKCCISVIKINGMAQDSTRQYKIAVVEDEPSIRNLYQTKLELCGFAVQTASNGLEGLSLVRSFAPDLILLDLLMPQMSGEEMLAKLRAEDWGADVRVIILTNISRSEAPMSLRFLSVDRYVVKAHYTPSQIVEVIHEVLHIKTT